MYSIYFTHVYIRIIAEGLPGSQAHNKAGAARRLR